MSSLPHLVLVWGKFSGGAQNVAERRRMGDGGWGGLVLGSDLRGGPGGLWGWGVWGSCNLGAWLHFDV